MDPRIEQCKRDVAKLQEELKRLEDEAVASKPRHGDIVRHTANGIRIVLCSTGTSGYFSAYDKDGARQMGGSGDPDGVAEQYRRGNYVVIGNVFNGGK